MVSNLTNNRGIISELAQGTPTERLHEARDDLTQVINLMHSRSRSRGLGLCDSILVLDRAHAAFEALRKIPELPSRFPSEAEMFFRGASLEDVVVLVLETALLGEPISDETADVIAKRLRDHMTDQELERLVREATA